MLSIAVVVASLEETVELTSENVGLVLLGAKEVLSSWVTVGVTVDSGVSFTGAGLELVILVELTEVVYVDEANKVVLDQTSPAVVLAVTVGEEGVVSLVTGWAAVESETVDVTTEELVIPSVVDI